MFYVLDQTATYGPYSHEEARKAQDACNRRYGIDKDGEGYCNAIMVTEGQARMLGAI